MKRRGVMEKIPDAKKLKEDIPSIVDLQSVQMKIQLLDDECAKEQVKLQKEYNLKMKPHYTERQKIISKIPSFWGQVLVNLFREDGLIIWDKDQPILDLLDEVTVDEFLNDKNSYKIVFKFNDSVSKYFSPSILERHVNYGEDEEAIITSTPVTWTEENLIDELVKSRENKSPEEDSPPEFSIMEWFCPSDDDTDFDFAQVADKLLMNDAWQNPIPVYLGDMIDYDIEDNEDNEDSEEE